MKSRPKQTAQVVQGIGLGIRIAHAFILGGAILLTTSARGETLQEALAAAYRSNPTLAAERASLRATDELVPIARSDGLPALSGAIGVQDDLYQGGAGFSDIGRRLSASADLSVPLFSGGAVRNSVSAARARVNSGQAQLTSVESQIFAQVVAAYMDILRDEAIVELNLRNVAVLETNLVASRERFTFGELTRTDIAQSDARLSVAEGELELARADLISSRENYVRLVGNEPGELQQPPPLPPRPDTVVGAVEIALDENPDLEASRLQAVASDFDIDVARASRLPRVSVFAQSDHSGWPGNNQAALPGVGQDVRRVTAGLSLTFPLYQGGRPAAQIRQAQARRSEALELAMETERFVVAQTRTAFARLRATEIVITTANEAVDANALALEGVRAENTVGTRTVLDVLDAERELLNARVRLISAQRDEYVAAFNLLVAMGRAEAEDLGLSIDAAYDPRLNYERATSSFWDWDDRRDPVVTSTATSSTSPQNSEIESAD